MDFKQLESFVAVVNANSFSKAAEKMFLTQPTITNHIQALEEELGTVLINRSNKKIILTDAGDILYSYAIDIINLRDTAQINLRENKDKIEGILEISSSSIPGQYIMPYIVKGFIDKYANVKFKINHKNSEKVIEEIKNGFVNYGVVGGKYNDYEFLEYIDFFEDNLIVITPNTKKYKTNIYEALDKNFLLQEKIILREKGSSTRLLFEKELQRNHIPFNKLNIISSTEDNETIKKLVELGLGISVISELAVKKEIELGLIRPYHIKDMNLRRKFYYVYHKNRYFSPLDHAFRNFVVNSLNE
ncbi:MAG: LysR family transcriptional regulator [Clostridia bacterium]|nr:LysR family transcriptional regulator [Clostridia bacterium]